MTDPEIAARAEYYERWAADIRKMNGHSVDADYADQTARALTRLAAEKQELVEALTPFAKEAGVWPDYVPDADGLFIASPDDVQPILDKYAAESGRATAGISFSNDTVTVGDLRKARAALARAKGGE